VLWWDVSVLEDYAASIFRDEVKIEEARSSETLVPYCNTTKHNNPKDLDLELQICSLHKTKFRSSTFKCIYFHDINVRFLHTNTHLQAKYLCPYSTLSMA
jgi:hypothetical protein